MRPHVPALGEGVAATPLARLREPLAATRPRRRLVILSVVLGAGAVLAAVGLLATSGYLISRAAQRPDVLRLAVAIASVRTFGIARALLRYAERLASHELAFRTLADLRATFFRRLVPLVPGALRGTGRAEILSRYVADVDRLQDLYLRALVPPLIAAVAGLAAVLAAGVMLPGAAAVLAAFLVTAAVAVPALSRHAARTAGRRQAGARAALAADMVEIVGGAPEIALANREADWIARARRSSAGLVGIQARDAVATALGSGLGTTLAVGAAVAVVAIAIPAVGDGTLAGVLLAAVALLAMASFEAITPLPAAAASVDACASAATRLGEIADREPAIADPAQPLPLPAAGPLEMRGVRFRYEPSGPWILDGLDLRVEPGRAVALLGASGSGKTTIAEMAVRFLDPTEGAVAIGGQDVRLARQGDVRAAVRISSQDAYLFATTVRRNLAIARPEAGDAALLDALERVGLGPWISSLPEGLDTEVGERGAKVSGGQRQRLAAARVLLSGARFLVFDEPTAHLDEQGARSLLAELAATARRTGAGVLAITHVPDGLEHFDEVLELRRGGLRAAPPRWAGTDSE